MVRDEIGTYCVYTWVKKTRAHVRRQNNHQLRGTQKRNGFKYIPKNALKTRHI